MVASDLVVTTSLAISIALALTLLPYIQSYSRVVALQSTIRLLDGIEQARLYPGSMISVYIFLPRGHGITVEKARILLDAPNPFLQVWKRAVDTSIFECISETELKVPCLEVKRPIRLVSLSMVRIISCLGEGGVTVILEKMDF